MTKTQAGATPQKRRAPGVGWDEVQGNKSYRKGALTDAEAAKIIWHSPGEERSSQVFCISVFGTLRALPRFDEHMAWLFRDLLPRDTSAGPWNLWFEYTDRKVLGEGGAGIPTSIDVHCRSPRAVVCIEAKFLFDAKTGFGACSQVAAGHCAGHYGPKSDLKTGRDANCRLTVPDGKRKARLYWELGQESFQPSVYAIQGPGESCPFAGPHYQLMRNVLFAKTKAGGRAYGVLAIVPEPTGATLHAQTTAFAAQILKPELAGRVTVDTYDRLAERLAGDQDPKARELAEFMRERIDTLCRT